MKPLMTCLVAGSHYLIHPQKLGSIQETISPEALIPVTLLETSEIVGDVEATLRLFAEYDDVFLPEFGAVLVEKPAPSSGSPSNQRNAPRPRGRLYRLDSGAAVMGDGIARLPSGPYFLHGPNLHQAWKLYEDELDAFDFGVFPENLTTMSGFRTLGSLSESGAHKAIPVPSRLYHHMPGQKKPLNGIRIAVPDAVSVEGVRTGLSSRAWSSLYGSPADATAALPQRLLDLGAIIVGKTKSSQFASGREWVDQSAPWNPRGDGYQSPLGGAAGAGAAMAGYKWLKAAFGLDAIGGVREPAAAHGLYSLRTTPGLIPLVGSQPSSRTYDSVALVSRNLRELFDATSAVLNQSRSSPVVPLPKRLVYPIDCFASETCKKHNDSSSKFITVLESLLGIKADKVNISAIWERDPPSEANRESLEEYMKGALFHTFCYEFYHEYDEFRTAYESKFQHAPYAEATTKFQWDIGKNVTKREYNVYMQKVALFRKWFNERIMPTTYSNDSWTAMILPFDSDAPRYRDEPLSTPRAPQAVIPELLASMLRTPQLVIPFAQLPYQSRISGRKEFHAVYSSVLGPQGSDLMMVHFVREALQKAQWRTEVDTGRFAFPVAENTRNLDHGRAAQGSDPAPMEIRIAFQEL